MEENTCWHCGKPLDEDFYTNDAFETIGLRWCNRACVDAYLAEEANEVRLS